MRDGNLVVRADVPGLELKDLDVSVLRGVLTIKGERKSEKEVEERGLPAPQVSYGSFERRMSLPEGAVTDQVKANFKNGVLEITIPTG